MVQENVSNPILAAEPPGTQRSASGRGLALARDVRLHPQSGGNLHVEKTTTGEYFRLGPKEGAFLQELAEQGQDAAKKQNQFAAAEQLLGWLVEQNIVAPAAVGENAEQAGSIESPIESAAAQQQESHEVGGFVGAVGTIFYWRLPLGDPTKLLDRVMPSIGCLFSWQAEVLKLVLLFIGGCFAASGFGSLKQDYFFLVTPSRGIQLLCIWVLLKAIHELSHAAACRRYGGEVKDAGLAFIFLMPLAYVDVTSSWRFDRRWKRLHVSLAGVSSELLLASLAAIGFGWVESPALRVALVDLVAMAAVSSLVCNLNPLLKFDGYYAFSDLTGVDNLYDRSREYLAYWAKRHILGIASRPPEMPRQHRKWIPVYAVGASFCRSALQVGILTASVVLFGPLGWIVAAVGAYLFAVRPLQRLIDDVRSSAEAPKPGKLLLRLSMVFLLPFASLFLLPAGLIDPQLGGSIAGVVQFDPPAVIRAPEDGFVRRVFVSSGSRVQAGDLLLEMQDRELHLEIAKTRVDHAKAKQRLLAAQWSKDANECSSAKAELGALSEHLANLEKRLQSLQVRSPVDGHVVARNFSEMQGRYFEAGAELAVVGDDSRKRILLAMPANHVTELRAASMLASEASSDASTATEEDAVAEVLAPVAFAPDSLKVVVDVAGQVRWDDAIDRLESRASLEIPDESLSAMLGGPLPVVQRPDADPELESPCVKAYISLDHRRSQMLKSGQRCFVTFAASHHSAATALWRKFLLFKQKFDLTSG